MSTLKGALAALDAAGVLHCVRNGGQSLESLPARSDLDVLVARRSLARADAALRAAGFHRLRAPGHPGHRFYVTFDEAGEWRKVDVVTALRYGEQRLAVAPLLARRQRHDGIWVVSDQDEQDHRERRAAGLREPRTLLKSLRRRRPAALRRVGPVVAVLGPDGAGKGSTLYGACDRLPVGVTRVYLGNPRRAAAPASAPAPGPAPAAPRPSLVREIPFLLRKAVPLYRTLATAYAAAWRGHVVLCDRHPVEVLAIQPDRSRSGAALERLLFARLVPAPDHVVVLDAPGDVLFARKGEHDPVLLERRRQAYLATFVPPGSVVDTSGTVEQSVDGLLAVVWRVLVQRNGWAAASAPPAPPAPSAAARR